MASVTGMTVEAIQDILDSMVVSVRVDELGQVLFTNRGGTEQLAGPAINPTEAVKKAWPIGSIFTTTSSVNPATTLGIGTWVRHSEGRVLVGQDAASSYADAVNKTGGSAETILTINNLPAHQHSIASHTHSYTITYNKDKAAGGAGTPNVEAVDVGAGLATDRSGTTSSSGGGNTGSVGTTQPFNNLPPYVVVYFWKRTA